MHQDATWYLDRPQPRRLCVGWGPASSPKWGRNPPPPFRLISIVAKRLDALRCHLIWRYASAQETVFDGTQASSPKGGGAPPQFSAHVYCAKLLDGSRWHLDGGGPWSRPHCARWGHSSLPQKGVEPPNF